MDSAALSELPNGVPEGLMPSSSTSTRPRPLSQPLYDPYTGQYKGRLVPAPPPSATPSASTGSSASSLSDSADEPILADHRLRQEQRAAALDKIRILQSEVARTHLAMEGLGDADADELKSGSKTSLRGSTAGKRSDDSTDGVKDEWSTRRQRIDLVVNKVGSSFDISTEWL